MVGETLMEQYPQYPIIYTYPQKLPSGYLTWLWTITIQWVNHHKSSIFMSHASI